ncbi:hypothetical protein [Swaminathania salitolerans]|uniref:Uncharacterized protein n=1 Tax=Swaminathania salitolerans TaxID=182838 RepID=A0A511BNG0_9PROT|nr:hypothetical protein [Swaminathania salitolerans]GBQ14704.1 hypothetical protein AA21291_1930 [Swaminathania salitolerans LMG 21291]GEL01861.1 hypothetical protein SSA02_10240 [Swaminathania salitolerans]
MKTTGHSARIGPMGYALFLPVLFLAAALLMAGLSGAASARTQFSPPGGLPLTTQIGTATNSDGTPAVTLGSMQEGLEANGRHIAALQNAILSHDALAAELAPYLTQAEAEARYATQEAVAGAISGAVQAETDRAGSAERRNAEDIAAIRSGYVPTGTLNTVLRSYVTGSGLDVALAPYLTQDEAEAAYLSRSGGRTSGPLNGVDFLDGLVGSSAPGSAVVLTTDNSGAVNGANCMRVPPVGITGLTIVAAGVSSNGTDAVMQKFDGVAVFTAHGTPLMANQGASSNYPSFGSPGAWSVTASVDVPTRCVVITVRAGGSGSWKWRASMRAETLLP